MTSTYDYLNWEMKIEQIFYCHHVDHERRVVSATFSFHDGVMHWWTAYSRDLLIHRYPPINFWNELRSALRKRYLPYFYDREIINQLHRLNQKELSVDQYRQKMELLLLRAGIREEPRLTIARFLNGLSFDIRGRVELLTYHDLNDLVQICILEEDQLQCKSSFQKNSSSLSKSLSKDVVGSSRRFSKEGDVLKHLDKSVLLSSSKDGDDSIR